MCLPLGFLFDQKSRTLDLTWSERCLANLLTGCLEEGVVPQEVGVLSVIMLVKCVSIKARGAADWEVIPLAFLIARLVDTYITLFLVVI